MKPESRGNVEADNGDNVEAATGDNVDQPNQEA
jgi:hypothetical protein